MSIYPVIRYRDVRAGIDFLTLDTVIQQAITQGLTTRLGRLGETFEVDMSTSVLTARRM